MFKKTKLFEEKVRELNKELREENNANYEKSKLISTLINDSKQLEFNCSALKNKVERLEDELSILRGERKEIEDKIKDGVDKDAVIIQLILEKDRLAIENLKNHANMIEQTKAVLEAARLANQMSMPVCQLTPISLSCTQGWM